MLENTRQLGPRSGCGRVQVLPERRRTRARSGEEIRCALRVGVGLGVVVRMLLAALFVWCVIATDAVCKDYRPAIDPATFSATVDNPYFPLVPGTICTYVEKSGKHVAESVMTVTHDTKSIMGVTCIVVHVVVKENGELDEESFAWYAQDKAGNVWFFGEDIKEMHG